MSEKEKLLPLVKAVQQATGARPHLSTVLRWATIGARGQVMASKMLGGRRMTTIQAVLDFVEASTTAHCNRAASSSGGLHPSMVKAREDLAKIVKRTRQSK